MELFFESCQNELEISSMECDIVLDRTDLLLNCYNNKIDLFNESGEDDKSNNNKKPTNFIMKAIKAVVDFIKNCIDRINEAFSKHRLKSMVDQYNKLVKEDPSWGDKPVELADIKAFIEANHLKNAEILKEVKKAVKTKKFYKNNPEEAGMIKSYKEENERLFKDLMGAHDDHIKTLDKHMKGIKYTSWLAASGVLYLTVRNIRRNMEERKNTINELANAIDACNDDPTKIILIKNAMKYSKECTEREQKAVLQFAHKLALLIKAKKEPIETSAVEVKDDKK